MAQQLSHFFRILLAAFGTDKSAVFPNNLALFLKYSKSSLTISALKLAVSSFEKNYKILFF